MISCCRLQSGVPLASSLHALGYRTSSRPTLKDALPLNGCRWRRRRTLSSTKGLYRWTRSRGPAAHSPQIQRRGIPFRRSRKSTRGAAKYCTDSASPRHPAAKVAALVEDPYETTSSVHQVESRWDVCSQWKQIGHEGNSLRRIMVTFFASRDLQLQYLMASCLWWRWRLSRCLRWCLFLVSCFCLDCRERSDLSWVPPLATMQSWLRQYRWNINTFTLQNITLFFSPPIDLFYQFWNIVNQYVSPCFAW